MNQILHLRRLTGLVRLTSGKLVHLSTSSTPKSPAVAYLEKLGYTSPQLSAGMLNAISPGRSESMSTRELEKFGEAGLKQLATAVQRELDEQVSLSAKPLIQIEVSVPKSRHTFPLEAREGQTFYDLAQSAPLKDYLECACKGIAACTTCHVILNPDQAGLFSPPEEAEQDMLDLAAGLTETSRLGCQLTLSHKHHGLKVVIPDSFHNLF